MTTKGSPTKDNDTAKGGNMGSGSGSKHRWKSHEVDYLLKMKNDGKSIAEMSQEFERTESAIRQKLHKLVLKEKEENEKRMKEMLAALMCSVCSKQFDSKTKLNIHIGKKQDDEHKELRNETKKQNKANKEELKLNKDNKKNDKKKGKDKQNDDKKPKPKTKHKKTKKQKKKDDKSEKKSKKKQKKKTSTGQSNNKNIINQNQTVTLTVVTADKSAVALEQNPKKRKMKDMNDDEPPKKKRKEQNKLNMNSDECTEWLLRLGEVYKQYVDKWKSNGITGKFLNDMLNASDADLIDAFKLLVPSALHRSRIKHAWMDEA